MSLVASVGADVAAGTFETVGATQVGRLALAVPGESVKQTIAALKAKDIQTNIRELSAAPAQKGGDEK